ncbi:MAG: hypothetical protein CMJ58_15120 [Planctomycetaceae bacterium]|nr:hypothetical protein [Planctomycetaceae bacterium]
MAWEVVLHGTDRCRQIAYVVEFDPDEDRAYRVRLLLLDHESSADHPEGYYDVFNGELEAITETMDDIRREVALHLHKRRYK